MDSQRWNIIRLFYEEVSINTRRSQHMCKRVKAV